jgi:hypothetical protein
MNGFLYSLWLFCVTFALAGVQFVCKIYRSINKNLHTDILPILDSIQFALGGPLFTKTLKLSKSTTNIVMATAGPISGTSPV